VLGLCTIVHHGIEGKTASDTESYDATLVCLMMAISKHVEALFEAGPSPLFHSHIITYGANSLPPVAIYLFICRLSR